MSPFDGLADFDDLSTWVPWSSSRIGRLGLVRIQYDLLARTATRTWSSLAPVEIRRFRRWVDRGLESWTTLLTWSLDDFVDSVAFDGLASTSDQSVVQSVDKDNQSTWTTRLRLVGSLPTFVGADGSDLVVSGDQAVLTRTISRPCLR